MRGIKCCMHVASVQQYLGQIKVVVHTVVRDIDIWAYDLEDMSFSI